MGRFGHRDKEQRFQVLHLDFILFRQHMFRRQNDNQLMLTDALPREHHEVLIVGGGTHAHKA